LHGRPADEAVSSEPVCEANSLRSGNLTGNFTKIGPFGETSPVRTQQNQLVAGEFSIPYKMKQGINSRRTGNLLSRAGNLLRLAGNCLPGAFQILQNLIGGERVGDSSKLSKPHF
jgi:hypothetical protein